MTISLRLVAGCTKDDATISTHGQVSDKSFEAKTNEGDHRDTAEEDGLGRNQYRGDAAPG
jgi:hypothetical protein